LRLLRLVEIAAASVAAWHFNVGYCGVALNCRGILLTNLSCFLAHDSFEKLMSTLILLQVVLPLSLVSLFIDCRLSILVLGHYCAATLLSQINLLAAYPTVMVDETFINRLCRRIASSRLVNSLKLSRRLLLDYVLALLDFTEIDLTSLLRFRSFIFTTTNSYVCLLLLVRSLLNDSFLFLLVGLVLDHVALDRRVVEAGHR